MKFCYNLSFTLDLGLDLDFWDYLYFGRKKTLCLITKKYGKGQWTHLYVFCHLYAKNPLFSLPVCFLIKIAFPEWAHLLNKRTSTWISKFFILRVAAREKCKFKVATMIVYLLDAVCLRFKGGILQSKNRKSRGANFYF